MRRLPVFGEFDLITCIDDAINHLLEPDEVYDALASMRANLAPGGLLIFDVNTLAAYRQVPDVVVEDDDLLLRWRGALAELDQRPAARPRWSSTSSPTRATGCGVAQLSRQRHRHHPIDELCALVEEAGLEVAAVLGQRPGAVLDAELDEELHGKAVFVTRREGGRDDLAPLG